MVDLGTPVLLAANRQFHRLLVTGVPVQYQRDGETRGDFVRLVDWAAPARNEWLAVNQFSITGPHHTRRPDIVLFVNGLPLVLIELKNPADANADVWKAFQQIQTYKEQIADAFQYNEVLVISDGTDALLGSLSADSERFMAWRTIDGVTLDPLGPFNELQTLVRGVLAPAYLLDYLRFFVLFEDDGGLVKKIAGYHQFHAVRAAIAQVIAASRPDGLPSVRGKGGVVWHTQGSGKSITMTCFAARVMQEPRWRTRPSSSSPTATTSTASCSACSHWRKTCCASGRCRPARGRNCARCWATALPAASCSPRSRSSCRARTKMRFRCSRTATTSSSSPTRRTARSTASRPS